ncbi:MAG TPA: AMP-binding protein [Polyangiaceae bacterium]|nr:AMP-binding protein [Polyangiaceae bacterium]
MIHDQSLDRAARNYPQRLALISGNLRLTFSDLRDRVQRLASLLVRLGLQAGDRVAVLLPNEGEYLETVYACAWLGVIVVPLNTRLSAEEIDHILADAQPRGLIRHSSLPVPTEKVAWQVILDTQELHLDAERAVAWVCDPNAIFALLYTSGTTGRPKGVVLTHANILANVDHVGHWMPHGEGDVFLHAAPIFHIADFPFMFAAPAWGMCQVALPKFSAQAFCETVQRERVTHTVLVPTMINLLTQFAELHNYDLTSLKVMGYGGSPMAPALIHRARAALPGVELIQVYGLSETGYLTGLRGAEHLEHRLTSCGRPCPGVELCVVDDQGAAAAIGRPGELVARGENVTRGYWNKPEETARAFRAGFFRTGDVGYRDAEGFFYILDRIKDMIVTGGENVYSAEVEGVIQQHPAVQEVAVFGIPDATWGELVMACVALKHGASVSADELTNHCKRHLAHFKVPRRIEFSTTELAKGGSGKILKRALRARYWQHEARAVS